MPVSPEPETRSPVVMALFLLVFAVVGVLGWYSYQYLQDSDDLPGAVPPTEANAPSQADKATTDLKTQGSSDSLQDIEADLNATNLDGLDQEAATIESQL